ncbi:hypothetical protein Nepgr_005242 [Nepenthes gracilis]|uniref:Uncharacterized protein n=1 Tax=Nepenthes gracilis TaxID=150966 RepID=A0AAD3XG70_NEPGR|nr:hypothetical protein Nepgr_005242 [Nepenthes gracilis]
MVSAKLPVNLFQKQAGNYHLKIAQQFVLKSRSAKAVRQFGLKMQPSIYFRKATRQIGFKSRPVIITKKLSGNFPHKQSVIFVSPKAGQHLSPQCCPVICFTKQASIFLTKSAWHFCLTKTRPAFVSSMLPDNLFHKAGRHFPRKNSPAF